MPVNEFEHLYSTHDEADSRILFHLNWCSSMHGASNVVIRASDTDILIIVLGCFTLLAGDINIWLEVGIFSKNTQRYIDINSLYNKLGPLLSKSLLFLHALTGCDYTSSFS